MKRLALLCMALLLAGCGSPAQSGGEGELTVYASFYPMYDFASKVVGDRAQVICMVPAGMEAHDWEPSPQDMVALSSGGLLVYSGAGLEYWVEAVAVSLDNPDLILVETSQGLELMEGEDHGHDGEEDDHGHDHGGADPHVWLSPVNAIHQMERIKMSMILADPEGAAGYEANFAYWSAEFEELDREFRGMLEGLERNTIIVSHSAFGYLCREYGLRQVPAMSYSPEGEPDPARMIHAVEEAKELEIPVIFYETGGSDKIARVIAEEVGAEIAPLNPLESLSAADLEAGKDYLSVMRENLQALERALS